MDPRGTLTESSNPSQMCWHNPGATQAWSGEVMCAPGQRGPQGIVPLGVTFP